MHVQIIIKKKILNELERKKSGKMQYTNIRSEKQQIIEIKNVKGKKGDFIKNYTYQLIKRFQEKTKKKERKIKKQQQKSAEGHFS